MTGYKSLLDIYTAGIDLPDGYDRLLLKATHADLRTRNGFRWPYPGNSVSISTPTEGFTDEACPQFVGDGLSLAKTAEGMAQGGYSPATVLVVAVRDDQVLAEDAVKVKVSGGVVLELIAGLRANLSGADLSRADLFGANLSGADLSRADLFGANLSRANLSRANLSRANLRGANLLGADLSGAQHAPYAAWPEGFDRDRLR